MLSLNSVRGLIRLRQCVLEKITLRVLLGETDRSRRVLRYVVETRKSDSRSVSDLRFATLQTSRKRTFESSPNESTVEALRVGKVGPAWLRHRPVAALAPIYMSDLRRKSVTVLWRAGVRKTH